MQAVPPDFNPQPLPPQSRPPCEPPKFLKRQVYSDTAVFKHLDDHAILVASRTQGNFRELIWELAYCKQFADLEKARVIFRWMTAKNMYTVAFREELAGSPEEVLCAFKNKRGTYARIFETLCSFAGLPCVTLSGYAKGVDYKPGMRFSGQPHNHSWNAVFVNGAWQLVDCHWATRYLASERNVPENLVYEYDDFYFMSEPEQLKYSHWPSDNKWQLLRQPLTLTQFEELPLAKSFFFKCGMDFLQCTNGVLTTENGHTTLVLGFNKPLSFTFKLLIGEAMEDDYRGHKLKVYVLQETLENQVKFHIRAPKEGPYYMTLYAQEVSEELNVENVFRAACEYKIQCDRAAPDAIPLPVCSDTNWGPGAPVRQYGLIPSHKDGVITAVNGRCELRFAKTRRVRLLCKLQKEGVGEAALEKCVTEQEVDNQSIVTVNLPKAGEYGLEIYANDPAKDGDTFTHMCQYLVRYDDSTGPGPYGANYSQTMSSTTTTTQYGAPGVQGYNQYQTDSTQMTQVTTRMTDVTLSGPGSKSAPQTAPKPGKGRGPQGRGYGQEEDLPPPPPELAGQDMQYQSAPGYRGGPAGDLPPPPPGQAGQGPYGTQRAPGQEDFPPPPPLDGTDSGVQIQVKRAHPKTNQAEPGTGATLLRAKGQPAEESSGATQHIPIQVQSQVKAGQQPAPGQPGYQQGAPGQYAPGQQGAPGQYAPGQQGAPGQYAPGQQQYAPGQQVAPGQYAPGQQVAPGQYAPGQQVAPGQSAAGAAPGEEQPYGSYGQAPDQFMSTLPTNVKYNERIQVAQAPAEFKAVPIQKQQKGPPPKPAPKPNVNRGKSFRDVKVFKQVDKHAYEVTQKEHNSFKDLIFHLIYARKITNELEKVRAIFLWLCTKDLKNMEFNNVQPNSPEEIMLGLKEGKVTYAVVFETLCSYAGLHCITLAGYAKGADYKPGMRFTGGSGQHSWNAVLIDGQWQLVDCHWAARRLVGKQQTVKKVTQENVRYELDEYYFFPDPHQLIFTHFPEEKDWQLLERPLLLAEFENLAPVKSAFFKFDLQLISHKQAVISSPGEVEVTVACPPWKGNEIAFTFTLTFEDGREEYQGTKLTRYGMQEMVDNLSIFRLRTPEKGSYRFIIYAKEVTPETKEGVYGAVCEYQILCDRDASGVQPYPPCAHTSFGPGDKAQQYNLQSPFKGAYISAPNGHTEIKFKMPHELRFMAKLKSNAIDEKSLEPYVMHRVVNDSAVFSVNLPRQGEYGLELYANDPATDGKSLFHVWQYLVVCNQPIVQAIPFPQLPPGYLGKQPGIEKIGLTTYSHHDPYINATAGEMSIQMKTTQPLRVTSNLIYTANNEDFTDYILQQFKDNILSFVVKLPKAGSYKLQVYALPYTDTSESLPGVYNYLINCPQTHASLVAYPKQYAQWKEGCYLSEPTDGQLDPNRPTRGSATSQQFIYFKIEVPKASAVAVVVGEDWTQLDQKQPNVWEGQVTMDKHWGVENRAAVCANYGSFKASYSTLLEYTM